MTWTLSLFKIEGHGDRKRWKGRNVMKWVKGKEGDESRGEKLAWREYKNHSNTIQTTKSLKKHFPSYYQIENLEYGLLPVQYCSVALHLAMEPNWISVFIWVYQSSNRGPAEIWRTIVNPDARFNSDKVKKSKQQMWRVCQAVSTSLRSS